jgi:heat-inducible transcriptional repressor
MVRNVDYESRRRTILNAAVNRYIQNAEPVASEDLAADFNLSSATIRNVFSELEEAGYLTHPHTSGGRVPTDRGYRYYVDLLISEMGLLDDEKEHILKEYKKEIKRLEDALEQTSEIISRITHYAGIVSFLEWQDKFFYRGISEVLEQPEFRNLDRTRLLIRILEDRQRLLELINRNFEEKVKVYIGQEMGIPEMDSCSMVVSSYRIKERPLGRLAVLGPVRMQYKQIIPALDYISEVLSGVLETI